jgi:AraC-like DNA-binding protein
MQDRLQNMKYPIGQSVVPRTEFLVSCYHTPSDIVRQLFYVVLRAGHLRAAPDYKVQREHLPGHDLLLCLSGGGYVVSNNRRFRVEAGQLAWISGYHPHAHWADERTPWELLWIRTDGPTLQKTCNILSAERSPVFSKIDLTALSAQFHRIINAISRRPVGLDALLNAAVAEILALLFESRQAETPESFNPFATVTPDIQNALTHLALYPNRAWRVSELAKLSGLSEPHFFRRFRQATGSSPIDWLRRERISHARRRLLQSADPVQQIAEQIGYNDPFFFSRDFKRYTGVSPKDYRKQHMEEVVAVNGS